MLKKLHGRKLAVCLLGGAMYALFSAFGWQAEHGGVIWAGGALLVAALLVWPIAALLAVLLERGYTRALRREKTFHAGRAFAFILACYVPMFCVAFPGSFAYDVPYQLRQVVTGAYSTHHPLLHTLVLGGLLQLGRALGDINLGAALYTALQMALLAGCFALTCGSIARQSGARAAKRTTVFFALYPLNMVMAVNATKDVLFGGFFALTLAFLNEMQEKPSRGLTLKIAVCGALAVMLRNNMAYAALVWLALLTIGLRKREKSAALAVLLAGCAPAEGAAAATAQPTAEPTEAPTPTPEPEANPLTGEQGDYTNQRPVAVSIRTGDGSTPQWGIAAADVLIEGVTEGKTAGLTAVFASVDSVEKAGPVAPGRDLPLQLVLPLNAVPVHINKSVYASNLLNVLQYQDLDGYHAGTAGFAFDEDRANSGYREENCWYTTKDLINTGLATYNTDTAGANMPLFHFVQRKDPEQQNAKSLYITFSNKDTEELVYSPEVGLYLKNNADGSPMMDAGNNEQAAFTNVFVLYASSGVKDDGVTRQYDLTGGTGIYLTKGGWETIQWTKGDATAPLQLTDASGKTLDVNPGKSFLAIWGGYYGQALRLLDGDGNEQALPEKPALLDSAVPDEAAEAAEQAQQHAQALADAQDKLNQAQTALNEALQAQQDAAGTADSADDDAASQRVAEAQAAYDAAAAELAALQPAEEPDGNTEPAADSAEEPQSEPDSANGENAG